MTNREKLEASYREKAKDLVALALDENTSIEERRNAAVKAVKYIDKYDLLDLPDNPLEGLVDADVAETIGEAGAAVQAAKQGFDTLKKIWDRVERKQSSRRRYR